MRSFESICLFSALLLLVGCGGGGAGEEGNTVAAPALTVSVTGGSVQGAPSDLDDTVRAFRGIPYAAPPVGSLRWRPPQTVEPWDGVRDATEYAPACMQRKRPADSFYGPGANEMSEDCLYLNVWTAAESANANLPVMVWIHGGGLNNGTGAQVTYRGEALAKRGAVVVTTNYRLGPFGFFAHPLLSAEDEHDSSGNYGVLDQIRALEWVRDNIAAFGGDPTRVTIFGESAGSWSINYLQASPLAKGLFHRAIGESGGRFAGMARLRAASLQGPAAETHGERWIEALLAANDRLIQDVGEDVPIELQYFRAVQAEEIVDFLQNGDTRLRAAANVDGWVFEQSIYDIYASGNQIDVPVIVGATSDEGTTLAAGGAPEDLDAHTAAVRDLYGDLAGEYADIYPATDVDSARRAYFDNYADRTFNWEMRTWARMMDTVGSNAYLYYFSRTAPGEDSANLRAFHAAEIIYVFNNLGLSPYPYSNRDYDAVDETLSDQMAAYWVNFATTGDPNGEGLPEWPVYAPSEDRVMVLGDTAAAAVHPRTAALDLADAFHKARRAAFEEN